jgi:hypothetical protein
VNAQAVPSCRTCSYFHPDPAAPLGGTCSHKLQRCADVDPRNWCTLHSLDHLPILCCCCEDGPCNNAIAKEANA